MYNENDFCDSDTGFDYIFAKMSAIYGGVFTQQWRDVDPTMLRHVWKDEIGRYLTYRPTMDYALQHMNPDRPPSALAFKKLCHQAPAIPHKPLPLITKQQTEQERMKTEEAKRRAMQLLAEMKRGYRA